MDPFSSIGFFSVLTVSFAGSLHCLGMCGGIAGNASETKFSSVLYHLSRLVGYMLVGGIMGYFGKKALSQFESYFGFLLGITFLLSAFLYLKSYFFPQVSKFNLFSKIKNRFVFISDLIYSVGFKKAISVRSLWLKATLIGLFTPFLPCGWFYSFILVAFSSADIVLAFYAMLAFWLGTLPVLIFGQSIFYGLRVLVGTRAPLFVAAMYVFFGIYSINLHFGHAHHHSTTHEVEEPSSDGGGNASENQHHHHH